jgi:glycosyltransferase involved in cell wall biosynthesis
MVLGYAGIRFFTRGDIFYFKIRKLNKPIRILYIGGLNANQKGAIGTHTSGVINAFKYNRKVELEGIFIHNKIPQNFPDKILLFEKEQKHDLLSKIIFIIGYIKFLKKIINSQNYDYLYMRFDPFISPFIVNKLLINEYNDIFLTQVKIASKNGEWGLWGRLIRNSILYKFFITWAEKRTFKNTFCTVAVTKELVRYCINVYRHKVITLLNGTTSRSIEINSIRNDLDYLVLGHIGTLTYWDGLVELIEAIRFCINKFPDIKIKFLIIGEGSLKNKLEYLVKLKKLESVVFFNNSVVYSKVDIYFDKIDVVPILKTLNTYGLSPIKYYEALSFGKTLIVSNIEHLNELPFFAGKIVSFPLNIEEIANELYDLYIKREEIRENSRKINKYANDNLTWEKRIDYLIENLN